MPYGECLWSKALSNESVLGCIGVGVSDGDTGQENMVTRDAEFAVDDSKVGDPRAVAVSLPAARIHRVGKRRHAYAKAFGLIFPRGGCRQIEPHRSSLAS
jgi:hypothetical protein